MLKYQIAAGTVIPAGGYLVLTQAANFGIGSGDPGSAAGFGLSEYGFDLYLSSSALVSGSTVAGGYREHVDFSATPAGYPTGLYTKSTGGTDFTLLVTPTFGEPTGSTYPGAANSVPYQSPLVINEIMYHPTAATTSEMAAGYVTADFEYVEIYNRSGAAINFNPNPYLNWNESRHDLSGGIGFTFGWLPADLAGGVVAAAFTREAGAAATWSATGLGNAAYDVFATFKLNNPLGVARALDAAAQYTISHAGGTATVTIDQDATLGRQLDADSTLWVPLGAYTFNGVGSATLARSNQAAPGEETLAGNIVFRKSGQPDKVITTPTVTSPFMQSGIASIPAGGCVLAVSNAAAFNLRYNNGDNHIVVAGTYSGRLKDSGDSVDLSEHMTPDADAVNGYIPRLELEHVAYRNSGNWPTAADGQGPALQRIYADAYANDAANWLAHSGQSTPGAVNVMLLSYDTPDAQHVRLFFSEPLTAASAQTASNYAMVGATVSSAELNASGAMVTLALSNPMFAGLQYPLTVSDLATVSGNPAPSAIEMNVAYPTNDATPPSAAITAVSPNPRATPLSSLAIVFSEAVLGFNLTDLALRRDGGANLLTASQTLTSGDNIVWTLGNLSGLTAAAGDYALTLAAAGSGISDAAGNLLISDAATAWSTDTVAPTATITAVSPNPRAAALGSLTIVFSKAVNGFDLADLALRRDGGANLLTFSQTLTSSDNIVWTLGNVNDLTSAAGGYSLSLTAAGSGIADAAGNLQSSDAATAWLTDPVAPTGAVSGAPPTITAAAASASTTSVTVTYADSGAGIDASSFGVADLAVSQGATVTGFSANGNVLQYTIAAPAGVWGASSQGTYAIGLVADQVHDLAGNSVAANALLASFLVDTVGPSVAIEQAAAQLDPASAGPIHFTVTFSESVSDFDLSDVTIGGTAPGALTAVVSGGGATYDVAVSGMTGGGTVVARIAAAAAHDAVGNANLASTSVDNLVIYQTVRPTTCGAYDPVESKFYLKFANSEGVADVAFGFGMAGWKPLAGDWDGDGRDTIGLFQAAAAQFYLRNSNSSGLADVSFGYGDASQGDQYILVMGDWNGDGVDTIGLYHKPSAAWFLRNSNSEGVADVTFGFGVPGSEWTPIVGDWNGDGVDTIGLYDPATGMFYLRNSHTTGVADIAFPYGAIGSGWTPLIGDWDADGVESAGFYQPGAASP